MTAEPLRALRTALLLLLALGVVAGAGAPAADAHPLGNFSINHLSAVKISSDRVEVRYVLDQAEVPTFQDRPLSDAEVLDRVRAEVRRRLLLTVDGRPAPLRAQPGAALSHPPGQGGLVTTRVELRLRAEVDDPRRARLHDGTFPGRVGWRAVLAEPGEGTAVRSSAPSTDPTRELRRYPEGTLSSPLDRRTATFVVAPGEGTLVARREDGNTSTTTAAGSADGFTELFDRAAAGEGVFALFLVAAFAWGAFHALSPGHGKVMVAAYLVGTRGTVRHALALGLTVTVTHTLGVFALGLVSLALAQYVLPEDLYPWLSLASGLLVVGVGVSLLRSRLHWARRRGAQHHQHQHQHQHHHDHGRGARERLSWKGLIAMGASAGIVPCPSALVVLLGAIAQAQIGLGLLLIVAFSLGLAATLTLLGIVVVSAGRLTARLDFTGRVARYLPAVSTVAILALGLVLTANSVPQAL